MPFKEWLRENHNITPELRRQLEEVYFFESFDTYYEIEQIKTNGDFMFYGFHIRDNQYRIFIETMEEYDMIHIGFEKYDVLNYEWKIQGIDNELKNGEIQKLFETIIYVVRDLYKNKYNNILVYTNEDKKFRVYLRLIQQISKKLLPNGEVSHDDKRIFIRNINIKLTNIPIDIKTKYKPQK